MEPYPAADAGHGTGLGRRRQRLSDTETERRMLAAATDMIAATGLTVSLEHLRLEDVIREAGVSRSAVYRRWPYKDLFFADLLRQLAAAAGAGALPSDALALEVINRVAAEHRDRVDTPEQRHSLLLEILRQAGLVNFEFFHQSRQWRSYLAMHATFLSLPDGQLREDVRAGLTRSERVVIAQIGEAYEYMANLLGYRLRPELDATFTTLAELLNATMRGLVLIAPAVPELVAGRLRAAPSGGTGPAEWSQPALGLATIVTGFLEPDPAIDWTDERLTELRQTLATLAVPGTSTSTVPGTSTEG